jgi:hypothetical protein
MDTETVLHIIAMLDAKISLYTRIVETNHNAITYNKYELDIAIDTLKAFRDDLQEQNKLGE